MNILGHPIFQLFIEFVIFIALTMIVTFVYSKLKNSHNRFLNPTEFLPEDEIHTLKQVFYLILAACFFINFLYILIFVYEDLIHFVIFDICVSVVAAVILDKSTLKNKIVFLLLVPFGSLNYLLFNYTIIGIIDFLHVPIFLYMVKVALDKFMTYTNDNRLRVTVILLFSIVFISFLITQVVENKDPLDSFVMVSNAFTSNGYSVLGNSTLGKINSIFLVWGGYIISGAGTATLTAAILLRHFNARIKRLEKIIEDGGDE